MKLKEWVDFNFNNEQFKSDVYRINVVVYTSKSSKTRILDTVVGLKDVNCLFGDYTLFETSVYQTNISAMPLVRLVINKEEI